MAGHFHDLAGHRVKRDCLFKSRMVALLKEREGEGEGGKGKWEGGRGNWYFFQ